MFILFLRLTLVFTSKIDLDSLTPLKLLFSLEIRTVDDSWFPVLYTEFTKPYFLHLKEFLLQEKNNKQVVLPPAEEIYSWTRYTPFDQVKVVILGQDPYHNYNQAHGLAFSVKPPTPAPPSLKNMYIGIKNDYPDFEKPKNNAGCLIDWAKQGVLMLNASLTVRAHNANSHANKGWEHFTEKVLSLVAKNRNGKNGQPAPVCFLVWGNPASKRIDKIKPDLQIHKVLKTVHPSPLSAARGFFHAGHFRKTNEFLEEQYGPRGIINWSLDPKNKIKEIEDKLNSTQSQDKLNVEESKFTELEAAIDTDFSSKQTDSTATVVSSEPEPKSVSQPDSVRTASVQPTVTSTVSPSKIGLASSDLKIVSPTKPNKASASPNVSPIKTATPKKSILSAKSTPIKSMSAKKSLSARKNVLSKKNCNENMTLSTPTKQTLSKIHSPASESDPNTQKKENQETDVVMSEKE